MPGFSDNSRLADAKKLADYLTCGQCAQEFPLKNITNFIQHKTENCEKYPNQITGEATEDDDNYYEDEYSVLSCSSCYQDFATARGLLRHVQFRHKLNIFQSRMDVSESEMTNEQRDDMNEDDNDVIRANIVSGVEDELVDTSRQEVQQAVPHLDERRPTSMEERNRLCTGICCRSQSAHQFQTRSSSRGSSRGTTICCNSQECCVTIIPGTHEEPRKCCNSIVPKKRKLHMVKHMDKDGHFSKSNQEEESSSSTIYIALGSRGAQYGDSSPRQEASVDARGYGATETTVNINDDNDSNPSDEDNSSSDRGSVIIETGERFSIPITVTSDQLLQSNSVTSHRICVYNKPLNLTRRDLNDEEQSNFPSISAALQESTAQHSFVTSVPTSGTSAKNSPLTSAPGVELVDQDEDDDGEKDSGKKRRYPTSRPYKCEKCNDAFNQRIHLKKHMSKHTGVKPFKCQQCDYSTVERSHLKVHIRIHTGEKPFKCTHCEYATAQNSTLKIHLKRRHGGKMFQCDSCVKMFTQQSMLETHLTEHQKEPDAPNLRFLGGDVDISESNTCDMSATSSNVFPRTSGASSNIVITAGHSQELPSLPLPVDQVLSFQHSFAAMNSQQSLHSPISFPNLKLTKSS